MPEYKFTSEVEAMYPDIASTEKKYNNLILDGHVFERYVSILHYWKS